MLKKIDCVMIRVEDVKAAMAYYTEVFGLHPVWWDENSAGLVFPESDTDTHMHSETLLTQLERCGRIFLI